MISGENQAKCELQAPVWEVRSARREVLSPDFSRLPRIAQRLLVQRGLTTEPAVRAFLYPTFDDLHDPWLLPDIEPAVARIVRALERRERILVYGDYDVDGTTGTALLVEHLRRLGGEVGFYTPSRAREGYGLSEAGVRYARAQGCALIITVDCGTTDIPELELAANLGIDVVVTDHHEVPEKNPPACAFVNPKRRDSRYPESSLSGCGVVFKLAWTLSERLGREQESVKGYLDLVALATIADIVPLAGENRVLAKLGLKALAQTQRPGLRALLYVCGLLDRKLNSYDVGFVLGPRINATGRVGDGIDAVRLLLAEDKREAWRLARHLDRANQERKQIEEQAFEQALSQAEACASARPVVVLASENWHEGVIGIVAARIAERFYRPTILVAWDGDRGKGSGRSIPGFHLHDCLQACAQDLISFGGHKYAAGLVLAREKLPAFEQHVNEFAARTLGPDELKRRLMIDLEVSLEELDQSLLRVLEEFEPFGPENPRPVFVTYGLEVVGFPRRVGDRHLRFTVREKRQKTLPAIAYGRADDLELLQETQPPRRQVRQGDRTREKDSDFGGLGGSRADGREIQLDIAFQFGEHSYAGKTSLQLQVKDLHARRTSPDAEGIKREA